MTGLALLVSGCGDSFGPQSWDATPDTVTLFSASRAELLGEPAAYDLVQRRAVAIESPTVTGSWDFLLVEDDGTFLMLPAAAVPGLESRAGIAQSTESTLEAVLQAPSDTAAFSLSGVPIVPGRIYVMRSRREVCPGGFGSGVRYGKLHAIAVDPTMGTFRFAVVVNPFCNDRSLIPPEDDD